MVNLTFPDEEHPLHTKNEDITQGIIYRLNSQFDYVRRHGREHDGRKFTKKKAAEIIGLPNSTFDKWCKESPGKFNAKQVYMISQVLGLDLDFHWLRYGDESHGEITAQELARAYEYLSVTDRRLISNLVCRLLPNDRHGSVFQIWRDGCLFVEDGPDPDEI